MKGLIVPLMLASLLTPYSFAWPAEELCPSDDLRCRKIQMCDEEKAVTVRVLNDRKQQCDAHGGAACEAYQRSMSNPSTKRMLEKSCPALVNEGYDPTKR
jgi:hypothetical protein